MPDGMKQQAKLKKPKVTSNKRDGSSPRPGRSGLSIQKLDKAHWSDFVSLFGERGACGGCWCMSWRLARAEFESSKGTKNKNGMKRLVDQKEHLGLLAYVDGKPMGWCALSPREKFVRLEKARVLKRIDDRPVWSLPSFFITKEFRRKGLLILFLKEIIAYARKNRIEILEAYPIMPYSTAMPAAFAWTGFLSSFTKAGFTVARRWSKSRPIVRYETL